jgi:hypothetical protein
MSPDFEHEDKITFRAACKHFLSNRTEGKVHIATVYRYAMTGIHGVKLEWMYNGSVACTSVEAIQRFNKALSTPEMLEKRRENIAMRWDKAKKSKRGRKPAKA